MIELVLAAGLALAAPSPTVLGEDLSRWEALTRGDEAPSQAALLAFIHLFPRSVLAETAWVRAQALGPVPGPWQRAHRTVLHELDQSRTMHLARLERWPGPVPIMVLDDQGAPPSLDVPWTTGLRVGASLDTDGPGGLVGMHIGRGAWLLVARAQLAYRPAAGLGLRLRPGRWRSVWVELAGDSRARGAARVGVVRPVRDRVTFEASTALIATHQSAGLQLRFELTWDPGLK